MAGGKFLASRPVRYHAGSHSFVLRAKYIPYPTAPELGQFLAKSCDTKVAARNQIPILQRDYWDRQLRRNESYSQKWKYVVNNPVRYGYVAHAEDWYFQGELNVLSWYD